MTALTAGTVAGLLLAHLAPALTTAGVHASPAVVAGACLVVWLLWRLAGHHGGSGHGGGRHHGGHRRGGGRW